MNDFSGRLKVKIGMRRVNYGFIEVFGSEWMPGFVEMIEERRDFVNKSMESLDLSEVHQLLKLPTEYAILDGGKRLRPIICMLSAEALHGDYRETQGAFLALELIHNGTLVHDDIIDEDLFRRSSPSIPVRFGQKRAVLTGDALLSLGLRYAARTGNLGIVEWLSDTALKMVQGVALQTFFRHKLVSEQTYLDINYLKSGSLFEAAAALGGLVASDNIGDSLRLAEFGRNFGNAYQIRDDISGVYNENRSDELARSDIMNGDITLPFIYALESNISDRDRATLMAMYQGAAGVDVEELQRIYEETNAVERSMEKMRGKAEAASVGLEGFDETPALECILHLLDGFYLSYNPRKKLEAIV